MAGKLSSGGTGLLQAGIRLRLEVSLLVFGRRLIIVSLREAQHYLANEKIYFGAPAQVRAVIAGTRGCALLGVAALKFLLSNVRQSEPSGQHILSLLGVP